MASVAENTCRSRGGFALITVLWVMVGVSLLATAITLQGRDSVSEAQNRVDALRARWIAEGCAERAHAVADGVISSSSRVAEYWAALDQKVLDGRLATNCRVSLSPVGVRLDVNAASDTVLRALFRELGYCSKCADSLVEALSDWRDEDNVAGPLGAEASWYAEHHRLSPRNGPFVAQRELHLVRGLETDDRIDTLVDVEPGRLDLSRASLVVIRALPGISDDAAAIIALWRATSTGAIDLARVADHLAAAPRAYLVANLAELARLTTSSPDAWVMRSEGAIGAPPVKVALEERIVLSSGRVATVRRRWLP